MKKNKSARYTADQILYLRIGYECMNVRDLTAAFNAKFQMQKNECAIRSALKNHKITCGRTPKERLVNRIRLFAPDQIRFIEKNYAGRSVAELTGVFNRRFGTCMTQQQIKRFVSNRGITSGRTGHFTKGHRPWNSGTKGQGLTGPNKGSFKKGHRPQTWVPVGSERVTKDGIRQRKISDTGYMPRDWKSVHGLVWQEHNGPIPKGHVVVFRDGDEKNIVLENLMLVSRAELLRMNKHRYRSAPDELKPSVIALAKLEVKTFTVSKSNKANGGEDVGQ